MDDHDLEEDRRFDERERKEKALLELMTACSLLRVRIRDQAQGITGWPEWERLRSAMHVAEAALPPKPNRRGSLIPASLRHDAGAFARCRCGRYSDDERSLSGSWPCDCGREHGWCGSFVSPTDDSKWSEAKR